MKKRLLTSFFIVVCLNVFCQVQQNINFSFQAPQYFDLSFGTNGVALYSAPANTDGIRGIATQSDGKIVAIGNKNNTHFYVMRLNVDGSLDSTFGQNGFIEDDLIGESLGTDIEVDHLDRIIITGNVYHGFGSVDLFVVRTLPNGTYDNTFGLNGVFIAYTAVLPAYKHSGGLEIRFLNDGSIIIGGVFSFQSNDFDVAVYKITPNGQFDQSFGVNGYVYYQVSGQNSLLDMFIQDDGKILFTGIAFNPVLIPVIRLNTDGSLDNTFGNNGMALHDFTTNCQTGAAVRQLANKKILVAGTMGPCSQKDFFIYRLDENGLLDPSFGNNGFAFFDNGTSEGVNSLQLLPNGDILLLGGDSNADFLLVCYDSSGILKTNFGNSGKLIINLYGYNDGMKSTYMQSDGKILITGLSYNMINNMITSYLPFVRLNSFYSPLNELAEIDSHFAISPNPTSDQLTITLRENRPNTLCSIIDNLGKEVLQFNVSEGDNTLDVNHLDKGIYIVKIDSRSVKFVKN
jgi:uncharacterized delta-60 repeat protein